MARDVGSRRERRRQSLEIVAFAGAGGIGERLPRARQEERRDGRPEVARVRAETRRVFVREAGVLAGLQHPSVVRHLNHGTPTDERSLPRDGVARGRRPRRSPRRRRRARRSRCDSRRLQAAEALAAAHRAASSIATSSRANLFLVDRRFDEREAPRLRRRARPRPRRDVDRARALRRHAGVHGARAGARRRRRPAAGRLRARRRALSVPHRAPAVSRARTSSRCSRRSSSSRRAPSRELRPDVPPALDALVARMLAKDAADRPRDGAALLEELRRSVRRAAAPSDSSARRSRARAARRLRRPVRRRRRPTT